MSKTIVLTGARGNIGSAVKTYLENAGHNVICLTVSPFSLTRIHDILKNTRPDAFISCAALSSDPDSYKKPYEYYMANSFGVLNQLEMIRAYSNTTRFISCGSIYESKHNSPYSSSKKIARELVQTFRNQYGIYAAQVTLAHTESKNHKASFLARKITSRIATIAKSLMANQSFEKLSLIDIDQKFYWASSDDVAEGIYRCLFQDEFSNVIPSIPPETTNKEAYLSKFIKDYSLFSTEQHSIRAFIEVAFAATPILSHFTDLGLKYGWVQLDDQEHYCLLGQAPEGGQVAIPLVKNTLSGNKIEQPMRFVQGSSDFAQDELNWVPKITFAQMVQDMVKADL